MSHNPSQRAAAELLRFEDFSLDASVRELRRAGQLIPIQPKLMDLLIFLTSNPDRLLSRDEIFAAVWPNVVVSEETLGRKVSSLREVIGDDGSTQRIIQTVRGRGYRFRAKIEQTTADRPEVAAPPSHHGRSAEPFVGRQGLMHRLHEGLRRTTRGSGLMLLLAGEAGIGKSRTLLEFRSVARRRGARLLTARSDERNGAPSYWPWIQILNRLLEEVDAEPLRHALEPELVALAPIVPRIRAALPDLPDSPQLPAEQSRFQIFESLTSLLHHCARTTPTVLVFDDLQWADPSSLLLLAHLAHSLGDESLLVVGAYRTEEASHPPVAQALADLARAPACESISLSRLAENESRDLVRVLARDDLSSPLLRTVARRTDGNPLFITEMVHWLNSKHPTSDPDSDGLPELPESLRSVIGRRLDGLSDSCRQLLQQGSVLGREFSLDALSMLGNRRPQQLLTPVQEAVECGILIEVPGSLVRFRFSHELIRELLYQELPIPLRARIHAAAGEAIERCWQPSAAEPLDELAYHFLEAWRGEQADLKRALDYTEQAAARCLKQTAYEQAAEHYRHALELVSLEPGATRHQRCELLLGLGEAERFAGRIRESEETLREAAALARKLQSPLHLARAALAVGLSLSNWNIGQREEFKQALLEEALANLPESHADVRSQLLGQLCFALYWSQGPTRALAAAQESVALARQTGDDSLLVRALEAQYVAMLHSHKHDERLAIGKEMVSVAARTPDRELERKCRFWFSSEPLIRSHRAEALAQLELMQRIAASSRHLRDRIWTMMFEATLATIEGRHADAERIAHEYLSLGQEFNDPSILLIFGMQMYMICRDRGSFEQIEPALRVQAQQSPDLITYSLAAASVAAERGDPAEARREYQRLSAGDFSEVPRDMSYVASLGLLAELCCQFEDRQGAKRLFDLLLPFADVNITVGNLIWCGPVARLLGSLASLISDHEEAVQYFEKALKLARDLEGLPWLARTLCEYAEHLLKRDEDVDREHARQLFAEASQIAELLGLRPILKRIHQSGLKPLEAR